MHLTIGCLALLALHVVHTSSAPPSTAPPCYSGHLLVYLDGPAPISGWYRCLRKSLYTRDLPPAIFMLNLDMQDDRRLKVKNLSVRYKKNNKTDAYTPRKKVENFDSLETKVFSADQLQPCKCRSIRVTGLDDFNGVFVLEPDSTSWLSESYSNSNDSSHLKLPFPKQTWVLRHEEPLEADGPLSRLFAASLNASTSSIERDAPIDVDELNPFGVDPEFTDDALVRSLYSRVYGTFFDGRQGNQIDQGSLVTNSQKREGSYEQSWAMDRYPKPAGRAKRENKKFMQVDSLEKRPHHLTVSTDREIQEERVYKLQYHAKAVRNDHDHVSKNLKKSSGIDQAFHPNEFLNYYMISEQETNGKPKRSSKQKLFGVAKSLVYLPSRDQRERQVPTKSQAEVSEPKFEKNNIKTKHFYNFEGTTMSAFAEDVDLKMENNLGENIMQRGASEKMGNVEKKMIEQLGNTKTVSTTKELFNNGKNKPELKGNLFRTISTENRFNRNSGLLAEPKQQLDDDPNYEMKKYYDRSSVRIVKDDEEDAWLILEGDNLVAVSDDSSLCPDAYWGDWWQVRSQGSDVDAGVRDEAQGNDTDGVPDIINVPEDFEGPLQYGDILSPGPRGGHEDSNTDSGEQTRTVLVRKNVTLSCEEDPA